MSGVDISNIDKVQLLRALWNESKTAGFFSSGNMITPAWDDSEASTAVKRYIDWFQGRVIKSDLTGNIVDPWGYDHDNGQGKFASVVASLRKE